MGLGVSGGSAIILLGALIAGVTMYSAADAAVERVDEAEDADRERLLERRNAAINVTNATYVDGTLSLAVTNEGATTLSVNDTTVLVDNDYRSTANATVDGVAATDVWLPGETLRLNASEPAAPDRVTVVTGTGLAESTEVTEG